MRTIGLEGGCTCGAIRYRLAAMPYDTGWCHCRVCQRASGSAGMVFTTVPKKSYTIVQGYDLICRFQSTSFGERTFCRNCGAPLTIHVDHQPDEIDIAVGSLDEPSAVKPGFHLFVEYMPAWMSLADNLPRYPGLRPNTRGLEPGQTDPVGGVARPRAADTTRGSEIASESRVNQID